MDNSVIQLIQMLIPSISDSLAMTISYVLTFLIGLVIAIPAIGLWIRKKLPTIIAFLLYVHEQAARNETLVSTNHGVKLPLPGVEKKSIALDTLTKDFLDPKNEIITKKNLKLFEKIFGIAGKLGNVIEFVVPLTKMVLKKKKG